MSDENGNQEKMDACIKLMSNKLIDEVMKFCKAVSDNSYELCNMATNIGINIYGNILVNISSKEHGLTAYKHNYEEALTNMKQWFESSEQDFAQLLESFKKREEEEKKDLH